MTENDLGQSELIFQEFLREAQTAPFFCIGLAGFGNQVPPANQALDLLIKEFADNAFDQLYSYAMQLLDNIRQWWEFNGDIFLSTDSPKSLRHGIELAYIFLGLKRLPSAKICFPQLIDLLRNVSALPREYLQQNIRSICGCILNSSPVLKMLNVEDLIENSFIYEYYAEEQIESAGWDRVMDFDDFWATITMSDFLSTQPNVWIERIEQECPSIRSFINTEKFHQMWSDAKELQGKLTY